jgi:histidyl-tRNA synthetase
VWRDGPLKLGRYREFYQCDADLIGVSGVEADAEVMAFSCDLFASLGLEIVLKFNDRKLLNAVMEAAGIRETEKRLSAILSLDKLEKIGWEGVEKEMIERGVEKSCVVKLKELFGKLPKASAERVLVVKKFVGGSELGKEGIGEVERLLELSDYYGISGIIEFSPTLARGLSYYTGPMYECVLKDSKITSSVAGGGRYDELVGLFAGTRDRIPATGISFGMETIFDALKLEGKLKGGKTAAQAIVIPVKTEKECIQVARELRKFGVKALLDLNSRSLQRNLEYASKTGITYAVIVGEKELKLGKVKLRDLKTEREEELGIREAAREITGKS